MSKLLEQLNTQQLKKVPELRSGDTVKVHQKIKEGAKERIQIFEGLIIAIKNGKGISATITVRKVVDGVGVERIFPIHSPVIEKIEMVARAKVRRAKLYYLRSTEGKKVRLKRKDFAVAIAPKEPVVEPKKEETSAESVAEPAK